MFFGTKLKYIQPILARNRWHHRALNGSAIFRSCSWEQFLYQPGLILWQLIICVLAQSYAQKAGRYTQFLYLRNL